MPCARSAGASRLGVVAIDVGKGALAAWLALRFAPLGQALDVTAHGYARGGLRGGRPCVVSCGTASAAAGARRPRSVAC